MMKKSLNWSVRDTLQGTNELPQGDHVLGYDPFQGLREGGQLHPHPEEQP